MTRRVRIANAPASWGALEFGLQGEVAGWGRVLDEIASTGYTGTELGDWGFMPTDPDVLARELASRGLQLLAAFVPIALSRREAWAPGIEAALRVARLLAAVGGSQAMVVLADDNAADPVRRLNAGRVTPAMGLDGARWAVFAEGAERVARSVRENTGLRTVFHHHCGGYVETPAEIDRLMALTDPALLGLCLDTGHCLFGGGDPVDLVRRHGARIWHVHLKDVDRHIAAQGAREGWDYIQSVAHGVFCELGRGAVPFRRVRDALTVTGYDGWFVVEQDVLPSMGSPEASARRNRQYLAELGWA